MFKRNYIYQLKEMFRVKDLMFWNLLFPILLSTIMYISFSNMDSANIIGKINVGTNSEMFRMTVDMMEEETDILKFVEVEDPKTAVEEEEISGFYSQDEGKSTVLIKNDGLKTSVLINILNIFEHKTELINLAAKKGAITPQSMESTINELTRMDNYVESGFNAEGMSGVNTYYYAMIAMVCLGATSGGAVSISKTNNIPSNTFAKRLLISPVDKLSQILTSIASVLTFNLTQSAIVLLYMTQVLKIGFGNKIFFLILGLVIGTIFGLLLGILIALITNKGEEVAIGVCVAFYLSSTFLSGMMAQNVPLMVEERFPILNRINPATIIYKYFYTLNYFDDMENILKRLSSLVIATLITGIFVVLLARRRENANG